MGRAVGLGTGLAMGLGTGLGTGLTVGLGTGLAHVADDSDLWRRAALPHADEAEEPCQCRRGATRHASVLAAF